MKYTSDTTLCLSSVASTEPGILYRMIAFKQIILYYINTQYTLGNTGEISVRTNTLLMSTYLISPVNNNNKINSQNGIFWVKFRLIFA